MTRINLVLVLIWSVVPCKAQFSDPHLIEKNQPELKFSHVRLVDFDEDGDLDPLVWYDRFGILRNLGNGYFAPYERAIQQGTSWSGVSFDANGDGLTDWMSIGPSYEHVALAQSNGTYAVTSGWSSSWEAELDPEDVGDLDGDGDLDVLAAGDDVFFRKNDGQGVFSFASFPFQEGQGSAASVLHDLDADGDLDLVAAWQGRLKWWANDGSGNFANDAEWSDDQAFDLLFQDLNADGIADGVYLKASSTNGPWDLAVRMGLGNGQYAAPVYHGWSYSGGEEVMASDIEPDGDMDLVLRCRQAIMVARNDGTGTFGQPDTVLYVPPLNSNYILTMAVGDLTGDGSPEVCAGLSYWYHRALVEVRNEGNGQFEPALRYIGINAEYMTPVAGDVDGDGDQDLLVGEALHVSGAGLGLYRLRGAGLWERPLLVERSIGVSGTGAVGIDHAGLHMIDLNGDGWDDLYCADTITDSLFWRPSSGDGTFGPRQFVPVDGTGSTCTQFGDIDNDGDVDVLWDRVTAPRGYGWCLNDGSGGFYGCQYREDADNYHIGSMGDLNGDGSLDALIHGATRFQWAAGNAQGDLQPPPYNLLDNIGQSIYWTVFNSAVGDIDMDGDNDVLYAGGISNTATDLLAVYGDGAGGFSAPVVLYPNTARFSDFRLLDLDLDGDLDLATLGLYNERLRVYPNDGTGQFVAPTLVADSTEDCTWMDVDLDGLLDVVYDRVDGLFWKGGLGLPLGANAVQRARGLLLHPVPATGPVRITADAPITAEDYVLVTDASGRLLRSGNGNGERSLVIEPEGLSSGIFIVTLVRRSGARSSARMILH